MVSLKDVPLYTFTKPEPKREEFKMIMFEKGMPGEIIVKISKTDGIKRKTYTEEQKKKNCRYQRR